MAAQPSSHTAPQVRRSRKTYDVCIVGSGAGGGMAAHVLTQAGADVVMLEAGPMFSSAANSNMFKWPYQSPRRGAATPERHFGEFDACIGGWTIAGEPYTHAPGTDFQWFRGRNLGGRTHHWGRISLRFGPDDFRRRSIDGLGDDWPISYDDVAPYYDRLDRLVGLFGSNEGIPNEPDGIFLPPPRPRAHELLIKQAADRLGIPCIPSRLSILTKPHNGRPACHYCSQCGRGCATHSNFSSPSVLLQPALETGKLTIIPLAMAREVTVGTDGRATGVSYIDKEARTDEHVQARAVVLAASTCSTARILLNSQSSHFPDGLANSSGTVGHYLTDSTGTSVAGLIPDLMDLPPHNGDGVGGGHLYMPWWLDNSALDFPRGYHIELWGGRSMPGYGFGGGIHRYNHLYNADRPTGGGYGASLKSDYRRYYGATVGFAGRGEMVARYENYCELDPEAVDEFGIPVLRFHVQHTDAERKQARHMQQTFREIIDVMGGTPLDDMPTEADDYNLHAPGAIIHEAGTTRMGDDPNTSVLNANGQAHDCANLFVADAGPFVSQAHKNLTWTIMALAWRTSDHIADRFKGGTI